jgi:hypothetical protein
MIDAGEPVRRALEGSDYLRRAFPVLYAPGVKDEDVLIHSIGCSLWNTLGHELGYSAVMETPAPAAVGADIRSDSVWFDKASWSPEVLIEFERFESGTSGMTKLELKLANLLEAAQRWGQRPGLLILSAWSTGIVNAPDLAHFRSRVRLGIRNALGIQIAGRPSRPFLFNRMIFRPEASGRLTLQTLTFSELA